MTMEAAASADRVYLDLVEDGEQLGKELTGIAGAMTAVPVAVSTRYLRNLSSYLNEYAERIDEWHRRSMLESVAKGGD